MVGFCVYRCALLLFNGVMAAFAKWLTSAYSFCAHPDSPHSTVFPNRLHRVFGTTRRKPAGLRQQRRNKRLVKLQNIDDQKPHWSTCVLGFEFRFHFADLLYYFPEIRNYCADLCCEDLPSRIQRPIVFRLEPGKLLGTQTESLSQKPFCPVSIYRVADRFFRSRNPYTLKRRFRRHDKRGHETPFETLSFVVGTPKFPRLSQTVLFRQEKT